MNVASVFEPSRYQRKTRYYPPGESQSYGWDKEVNDGNFYYDNNPRSMKPPTESNKSNVRQSTKQSNYRRSHTNNDVANYNERPLTSNEQDIMNQYWASEDARAQKTMQDAAVPGQTGMPSQPTTDEPWYDKMAKGFFTDKDPSHMVAGNVADHPISDNREKDKATFDAASYKPSYFFNKNKVFLKNGSSIRNNSENPFNFPMFGSRRHGYSKRPKARTTRRRRVARTKRRGVRKSGSRRRLTGRGSVKFPRIGRTTVRGRGKYTLSNRTTLSQQVPMITRHGSEGGVIFSKTEFIGQLYPHALAQSTLDEGYSVEPSLDGASGLSLIKAKIGDVSVPVGYKIELNPGLRKPFPWFCEIARKYERFRIKKMVFTFQSTTNSQVAQGEVCMAHQINPYSKDLTDKEMFKIQAMSNSMRPDRTFSCGVECNPRLSPHEWKYVRQDALLASDSQRKDEFDYGNFYILSFGTSDASTKILGDLHVTYEIELSGPQLEKSSWSKAAAKPTSGQSHFEYKNASRDAARVAEGQDVMDTHDKTDAPNHASINNWLPMNMNANAANLVGGVIQRYAAGSSNVNGVLVPLNYLNKYSSEQWSPYVGSRFTILMPPKMWYNGTTWTSFGFTYGGNTGLLGYFNNDSNRAYPGLSVFPDTEAARSNCLVEECNIPVILDTEQYQRTFTGTDAAQGTVNCTRSTIQFCAEPDALDDHYIRVTLHVSGSVSGLAGVSEVANNLDFPVVTDANEWILENCEAIRHVPLYGSKVANQSYDSKYSGIGKWGDTASHDMYCSGNTTGALTVTTAGVGNTITQTQLNHAGPRHRNYQTYTWVFRAKNTSNNASAVKIGIPAFNLPSMTSTGTISPGAVLTRSITGTWVATKPSNGSFLLGANAWSIPDSYNCACDMMQFVQRSLQIEIIKDINVLVGGNGILWNGTSSAKNEFFI